MTFSVLDPVARWRQWRQRNDRVQPPIVELVYELLDAHYNTVSLASEGALDLNWRAHLEYLQALQRKGRETLAHAGVLSDVSAAPKESAAACELPTQRGR